VAAVALYQIYAPSASVGRPLPGGLPAHEILAWGKLLGGYCPDPAVTAPYIAVRETEDRPDE